MRIHGNSRNSEHYYDPTATEALAHIAEQDLTDAKNMKAALLIVKEILRGAGFEVEERIVLRNIRTGKIYR